MKTFPIAIPTAGDIPLYLAPMAGVSDQPWRMICKEYGADVVVTEFLAAEAIRRERPETLAKMRFSPTERPIGVQIFGADPGAMGEAARLVTDVFEPDFIDINFGCPVKKVVKRNGGSGCLKDLGLVVDIIESVSRGTSLPVTVKIRSGWSDEMRDPVGIALRCQDAGAKLLTLHARTRSQMYSGKARWDEIAAVARALEVPVIGNGDIVCAEDVVRMVRETGCDGVMIARGSFGQPWIFQEAKALLAGGEKPDVPGWEGRIALALRHAERVEAVTDQMGALVEFRKHLGWYVKGFPSSGELRRRLYQTSTLDEIRDVFAWYRAL